MPPISPATGRVPVQIRQVASWLGSYLAVWCRALWDRIVTFVEDGKVSDLLGGAWRQLDAAIHWARTHDTVPPGTLERAVRLRAQRLERADQRREVQRQRRLEKEEARKLREQKHREKSSIYLE